MADRPREPRQRRRKHDDYTRHSMISRQRRLILSIAYLKRSESPAPWALMREHFGDAAAKMLVTTSGRPMLIEDGECHAAREFIYERWRCLLSLICYILLPPAADIREISSRRHADCWRRLLFRLLAMSRQPWRATAALPSHYLHTPFSRGAIGDSDVTSAGRRRISSA